MIIIAYLFIGWVVGLVQCLIDYGDSALIVVELLYWPVLLVAFLFSLISRLIIILYHKIKG